MSYSGFSDCPQLIRDYLFYIQTIKGLSPQTVSGYYIDLRTFFRFINRHKNLVDKNLEFTEIPINNIDIGIIKSITLSDVYEYLNFALNQLQNSSRTRSRKVSSVRSFFNYLTIKVHLLENNPIKELEVPSTKKSLPKYLTLEQCLELLNNVDGKNKERDYCIITLFLNCGMRLSELVGINLYDITENRIRLLGKGNKERIIYLNEACISALEQYKTIRNKQNINGDDQKALFVSRNGSRISKRRVQEIIEYNLKISGLANSGYSTHKLRHTAATIMYQHGNVNIKVLQEILGHANLGTTEIYTHVSNSQMEKAAESTPLSKVKKKK